MVIKQIPPEDGTWPGNWWLCYTGKDGNYYERYLTHFSQPREAAEKIAEEEIKILEKIPGRL